MAWGAVLRHRLNGNGFETVCSSRVVLSTTESRNLCVLHDVYTHHGSLWHALVVRLSAVMYGQLQAEELAPTGWQHSRKGLSSLFSDLWSRGFDSKLHNNKLEMV